jgi:hypothetical protein
MTNASWMQSLRQPGPLFLDLVLGGLGLQVNLGLDLGLELTWNGTRMTQCYFSGETQRLL